MFIGRFIVCPDLSSPQSDCPNYCNKALSQHQFSINAWGHNRHEQVLDPWVLSWVCLIPFVLWSDILVDLLYTPYANGPKGVPFNNWIVYNVTHNFLISQSFLLNMFRAYTGPKLSTPLVERVAYQLIGVGVLVVRFAMQFTTRQTLPDDITNIISWLANPIFLSQPR